MEVPNTRSSGEWILCGIIELVVGVAEEVGSIDIPSPLGFPRPLLEADHRIERKPYDNLE